MKDYDMPTEDKDYWYPIPTTENTTGFKETKKKKEVEENWIETLAKDEEELHIISTMK